MTVLEAIETITAYHHEYRANYNINYEVGTADNGNDILYLKGVVGVLTTDFDWSCVDIHTVENTHFTGYILDLDNNRNLKSLDGMIFDGNFIRAARTGVDRNSRDYIQKIVRKNEQ